MTMHNHLSRRGELCERSRQKGCEIVGRESDIRGEANQETARHKSLQRAYSITMYQQALERGKNGKRQR